MKWLLDEGLPKALADWLRESGEDVLLVAESEYRGQPDRSLWLLAGREERVILTRDRGFAFPALEPSPPGIVVVRVPDDWNGAAIALFIANSLQRLGFTSLVGNLTVIDTRRARRRSLAELARTVSPPTHRQP